MSIAELRINQGFTKYNDFVSQATPQATIITSKFYGSTANPPANPAPGVAIPASLYADGVLTTNAANAILSDNNANGRVLRITYQKFGGLVSLDFEAFVTQAGANYGDPSEAYLRVANVDLIRFTITEASDPILYKQLKYDLRNLNPITGAAIGDGRIRHAGILGSNTGNGVYSAAEGDPNARAGDSMPAVHITPNANNVEIDLISAGVGNFVNGAINNQLRLGSTIFFTTNYGLAP